MKPTHFLGDSKKVLRGFPITVRKALGFQIERIQIGLDPYDWKPMKTVGPGVREIRLRDSTGAYRVIYVATLASAVYILHVFQKTSQSTAKHDIELATARFKELMREER